MVVGGEIYDKVIDATYSTKPIKKCYIKSHHNIILLQYNILLPQ